MQVTMVNMSSPLIPVSRIQFEFGFVRGGTVRPEHYKTIVSVANVTYRRRRLESNDDAVKVVVLKCISSDDQVTDFH